MVGKVCVGALVAIGAGVMIGTAARQPEPATPVQIEVTEPMLVDGPGAAHEALSALAGSWTWTSVFRMDESSPGAEPESGTAEIQGVLGGRFIQVQERGVMMGEAYEAIKSYGFNNAAGVYEGSWMYSGSTAIMRLRGVSDDGGRITVFQAQFATSPEEAQRFVVTMSVRDADHFSVQLIALMEDGTSGPRIETAYERVR